MESNYWLFALCGLNLTLGAALLLAVVRLRVMTRHVTSLAGEMTRWMLEAKPEAAEKMSRFRRELQNRVVEKELRRRGYGAVLDGASSAGVEERAA